MLSKGHCSKSGALFHSMRKETNMSYYIAIDLGGTNAAAAVVDSQGQILNQTSRPTHLLGQGIDLCFGLAQAATDTLLGAELNWQEIESIGIGVPGRVHQKSHYIHFANNLPLENLRLDLELEKLLNKKVYLGNDGDAAALGEAMFGAGQKVNSLLVVTLGTGVGGGFILDGKIFAGANGMGNEIGHMGIVKNGRHCSCGRCGCLEAYASATALIESTREAMTAHPHSQLWHYATTLEKVNGQTAFLAQKQQDPVAEALIQDYTEALAYGLSNLINLYAPEVIALGGGLSQEGQNLLDQVTDKISQNLSQGVPLPTLTCASLGNNAGLIGAACLAGLVGMDAL